MSSKEKRAVIDTEDKADTSTQFTFRIPAELYAIFAESAWRLRKSRSQLAVAALRDYLSKI